MQEAKRIIHQADALEWLEKQGTLTGCSMITSMPDFTEFSQLSLAEWKQWFQRAASLVMRSCAPDGVSIFYQRDSKKDGTWIDKSFLIQKAAEEIGHELLWHKIICRAPAGQITFGKPAYSHLLCFAKNIRLPLERSTVDVLPLAGEVTWTRGMGLNACVAACKFVLENTSTRAIVDPFCGHGSVLAVANTLGLDAIGVELGRKRAEKAQVLRAVLHPPGFLEM